MWLVSVWVKSHVIVRTCVLNYLPFRFSLTRHLICRCLCGQTLQHITRCLSIRNIHVFSWRPREIIAINYEDLIKTSNLIWESSTQYVNETRLSRLNLVQLMAQNDCSWCAAPGFFTCFARVPSTYLGEDLQHRSAVLILHLCSVPHLWWEKEKKNSQSEITSRQWYKRKRVGVEASKYLIKVKRDVSAASRLICIQPRHLATASSNQIHSIFYVQ